MPLAPQPSNVGAVLYSQVGFMELRDRKVREPLIDQTSPAPQPGELAPYAFRTDESRGRRFPEPLHPYRGEFERDRDRVLHSRAFRRLEDKTQVFSRRSSDHFRNRLTHTLEVSQISRTVARTLHLNQDLVEALALVHDIGHPPFGHAGEEALDQLMRLHRDAFDHNLHALRIVESFELKYAAFPGLNLSFEVREGIIKHSRDYDPARYPELGEYLLHLRPPLEAQLIDLADEIAYNCADLDDGYESKLIDLERIRVGLPLFDRFFRVVERRFPQALEKLKFNEALKRVMDHLVTDLIRTTSVRLKNLKLDSSASVRQHPKRVVSFSPRVAAQNREIKAFLYAQLYSHADVKAERTKMVRKVNRLFKLFTDRPRLLPPSYFNMTRHEPVHRVVCDYLAGMTDHFLHQVYARMVR